MILHHHGGVNRHEPGGQGPVLTRGWWARMIPWRNESAAHAFRLGVGREARPQGRFKCYTVWDPYGAVRGSARLSTWWLRMPDFRG